MRKKEMTLPLLFAAVAFVQCILSLAAVDLGWNYPVSESSNHFSGMLIFAFCLVLMSAYPYHLLRPSGLEVKNYVQTKSFIFGCCALPFVAIMAYISQVYGEGLWYPQAVRNVWEFSIAYVACCLGFMLFLVTTAYDLQHQRR